MKLGDGKGNQHHLVTRILFGDRFPQCWARREEMLPTAQPLWKEDKIATGKVRTTYAGAQISKKLADYAREQGALLVQQIISLLRSVHGTTSNVSVKLS